MTLCQFQNGMALPCKWWGSKVNFPNLSAKFYFYKVNSTEIGNLKICKKNPISWPPWGGGPQFFVENHPPIGLGLENQKKFKKLAHSIYYQ
jgi:hypothetical protein